MTKNTKTVNFSIDGKWLADMSRTRVEEGDYQHALKILDCLEGMSMDDKISILKGEKDLSGNNDLYLIEGSKELRLSIIEKYNWKYGSLLKFDGCYYKPYMIINSWSIEDLPKPGTSYSNAAKKLLNKFEPELYRESHRPKGRCFCEISPTIFF